MRRTFCFARNWRPNSDGLRRRVTLLEPGGYGLRPVDTEHFGVKQRSPLRNSFTPSRRHSLQTGPLCRAKAIPPKLDAAWVDGNRYVGWASRRRSR